MQYEVEDLPNHGVILLPPSSPDYPTLLADIENRLANPIPGSPPQFDRMEDPTAPTAILCNRSQTAIVNASWIWKWETEDGQARRSVVSSPGVPSVLAPFGLDERTRKLYSYWHVIFPGSKRLIRGSVMFGNNTDVRSPQPDELWKGGGLGFAGGVRGMGSIKSITLALDSVLFKDGGFTGPDTLHKFDRMKSDIDAYLAVAQTALAAHNKGLSPAEILDYAELKATASPQLSTRLSMMRRSPAREEQVIRQLISWANVPAPHLHKL